MNDDTKRTAKKIKRVRRRRGLTQRELAERVGVSREHIARLEAGSHDLTVTRLRQIAAILRVRVERLL